MLRLSALLPCLVPAAVPHDGPDPLWHWLLTKALLADGTVRRGHHFCFVAVHGDKLEFKAFDIDGHLFDVTTIEKRPGRGR